MIPNQQLPPLDPNSPLPVNPPMMVANPLEEEVPSVAQIDALMQAAHQDPDLLTPEEKADLGVEDKTVAVVISTEDHYKNLAEDMDKSELGKIASDLITLVESDEKSRDDWHKRVKNGIRNLGVSDKVTGGASFPGASTVVHPVLMEACTQFQARAIQEMWPSGGPVQTQLLGEQTPEKQDQAERVQNYMNYLYTTEMTEAFDQEDNMLLRLPISGSTFKKMYYCPLKKRLASMFVEPADFIVSYQTEDLMTSPRFAHRIREYKNDVKKKEASGFYKKCEKDDVAYSEDTDKPMLIDEIDHTEGKSRSTDYSEDTDEDRVTLYEVYVDYIIEDKDKNGKVDSKAIAKPYIITIDRDQQTIKRIQRNWKPNDCDCKKRMYFTHYKFTPGLGFYGYGFLHLIGDMAATATGALRSLLDAAAFANLQGGFRTRGSRKKGDEKPIRPGEWRETDATAEDLKNAFFHVPYKEPSQTLFTLLGYVDDKARHLAGITETTTGETNAKNSPVGTTAMLLEQGTKVFTAIHKRIHEAHKKEFKIMAELIEEYMPDEGYPYLIGTKEGTVMPQDFDERVDVIPVSDPNISSTAQRVAKAQSILELQQQYPHIINERAAVKRMLEAIQVQNIEELIGDDQAQQESEAKNAEKQQMMEELEKVKVETDIAKMKADAVQIKSISTKNHLESMKIAFDAAALAATTPELVEASDALMKSAGFEDMDEGPGIMNGVDLGNTSQAPELKVDRYGNLRPVANPNQDPNMVPPEQGMEMMAPEQLPPMMPEQLPENVIPMEEGMPIQEEQPIQGVV